MTRLKTFYDELVLHIISDINLYILFLPIIYFVLALVYKCIRHKFPVRVNCWFCNKDTAIDYKDRNSFTCPYCKQYNGFTEDGDYNKPIPEQQDELLNHIITPTKFRPEGPVNGLCKICNNNQQLKIYQLANFVPLDEDNFDVEIEHFQKQLEKAYKLCPSCNSAVKNTIAKQNRHLLGKQIEDIRKSGKTLLNQSSIAKITSKHMRWYIMCSILCISLAIYYARSHQVILHNLCSVWMTLLKEYSREMSFAIGGSLFTTIIMYFMKRKDVSVPIVNTKMIKKENLFNKPRYSGQSYISNDNLSSGDLSFASFNSQLNSTGKSDDESSFSSELAMLTSNQPSHSPVNRTTTLHQRQTSPTHVFGQEATLSNRNRFMSSSSSMSSFKPCKSSAPVTTLYNSYKTAEAPFMKKTDLDLTFENLNLTSKQMNFEMKRSILSPSKFRNPWTGKNWESDALSRSSSQSSGVYSRTTSICGDDVASVTSEPLIRSGANHKIGLFSDCGSGNVKSQGFSYSPHMFDHINQVQPPMSSMRMIYD